MNELVISNDKIQLLKDQICKGATDSELQLFITTANRTGLDPFSKQCWAVKRWDSNLGREIMSFQTGIDGFRVIANRSDKYAGQLGPFWCGEDGIWKDVWLDSKPPIASKVAVLRSDFKEPLWAVAKFNSYAGRKKDGSLTPFWLKMPELMIAKVAECLALRKAFPQDLSGIYSSEEMDQAENEIKIKDIKEEPKRLSQQVVQTKVEGSAHLPLETVNSPVEATSPSVIVNHAVEKNNSNDWKSYKLKFNFGSFKSGLTFEQLGVKDTQTLIKAIKSWQLSKGTSIPQFDEFISLSNNYLESLK